MRLLWFSALCVVAAGCDDTEFNSSGASEYEASATGAVALMHDHCIECHPSLIRTFSTPILIGDIESGEGEFVVAGDAAASVFWQRMVDEERPMPPTGLLPADQIEGIRTWIDAGAPLFNEGGDTDDGGEG